MLKVATKKDYSVEKVMKKISVVYQSNSRMYADVAKALMKLSFDELDCLGLMIDTSKEG